jgi:uncharacterized protein (TIGR03435 family)
MAQVHVMLQNLLIARLQIKLHHETRQLPGFEVVVTRTGLKMKQAVAPAPESAPTADQLGFIKDANGLPQLPPGRTAMKTVALPNGLTRIMGRLLPISILVNMLAGRLDSGPVMNKTGLTAKYDFTLDHAPAALAATSPGDPQAEGPDLVVALKDQLGLQLEPKHVSVDVLVIDSADRRPIEN